MDNNERIERFATGLNTGFVYYHAPQDPLPVRPSKPFLKAKPSSSEVREYADRLAEWENKIEIYNTVTQEYREEKMKRHIDFVADAAAYHGLTQHPKWPLLFSLAWADGHSEGYQSVAQRIDELGELLK